MINHLGDMMVVGKPPAKLVKALAVIADTLHPSFNANPNIKPDWSRRSCVLCSLTVRDFLQRIGFADATVRSVATFMFATRGKVGLHSLGIGSPDEPTKRFKGDWCGHMVATVDGWLIDTTLYPARRPQWPALAGQVAVPLYPPDARVVKFGDLPMISAFSLTDADDPDYEFCLGWCDRRDNDTWRRGPDCIDVDRRVPSVEALVARFGEWSNGA